MWGNNYKTRIQSLFILHKRAIRIICLNTNYKCHTKPLFYQLSLTAWCLCTRHFTIHYLQICCPTSKKLMAAIIIYTRNNNLNLKIRYRRTTKKALSICVKASNMWNYLSPDIKLSRKVNAFKKMLKSSLLENYKFWKSEQFLILQFIEFVLRMIYFISLKRYN